MKVALGVDHRGFTIKDELVAILEDAGHQVVDLGTHSETSVDYPDFGEAVALAIGNGEAGSGVIICGTGIGIAVAANRYRHVRAAVCHDVTTARLARQHNDANVLALGARIIGEQVAKDCLLEFLATAYEGGRHDRRVAKLNRAVAADFYTKSVADVGV